MGYTAHTWTSGDVITAAFLNALELAAQNCVDVAGDTMTGDLNIIYSNSGNVTQTIKNTNATAGQNRYGAVSLQGDNGGVQLTVLAGKNTSNVGTVQLYSATNHKFMLGANGSIYQTINTDGSIEFVSGTLTANGNAIWNAGNDGPGSGLDADTLDGVEATGFMNNVKAQGNVTYNESIDAGVTTKNIALGASGYDHGMAVIHSNDAGSNGKSIMISFGTDSTKTLVINPSGGNKNGIDARGRLGYCGGNLGTASDPIRVDEAYISGSNLRIDFNNTGAGADTLTCTIYWEVW